MQYFQSVMLEVLLTFLQCVYVYSGSLTGSQLTEHIKYYEAINYNIEDVAQQHSRTTRSIRHQDVPVEIQFYSHDRHFHIRLRRDTSIFMQDFALITSQGEIPHNVNNIYAGEVVDEPGSFCHGTITNGTLNGRIYTDGYAYTLEPAKLYFESADFHSVMYADKHVDKNSLMGSGCGVTGDILKRMQDKLKKASKSEQEETMQINSRQRRQSDEKIMKQTCPLYIQTDHVFYQRFGSQDAVVSYILGHVQAADYIYRTTDFDPLRDIRFAVSRLRVWTPEDKNEPNYKFGSQFIGVEKFLDLASEDDWSNYCASYTFTNRDFSNGVLGLAWIASSARNSDGGICSGYDRSQSGATLNTGIVTLNNYGSFVPQSVSHLTFAHEIGHNFGSLHDPNTAECTPGGDQGNYLMFAHASAADKTNNGVFSLCSKSEITDVLNSLLDDRSKQWCLVEMSSITVCGNGIVEDGEECDCGYEDACNDKCCHAQTDNHDDPLACKRTQNSNCSPSEGACCNPDTCSPHNGTVVCSRAEDCLAQSICTGNSIECPEPEYINENQPCDGGRLLCQNGNCSQSICTLGTNLEPCQCAGEKAALCQVCCQNPNQPQTCVPSYRLNIPPGKNDPTYIAIGSPCNNYMGYCDVFSECRLANEDGPLASIVRKIFFSNEDDPEILEALEDWLQEMWWVVLIAVICLILVMVAIVLICDRLIPTSNPFRMEKEKFKKWRRSSQYVKFRGRQDRNTQYGRRNQSPANMDDHPDSRTESRATAF